MTDQPFLVLAKNVDTPGGFISGASLFGAMLPVRLAAYERRFGRPYVADDPDFAYLDGLCRSCDGSGVILTSPMWRTQHNPLVVKVPCDLCANPRHLGADGWEVYDPNAARVPHSLVRRFTNWEPNIDALGLAEDWLASWPADPAFLAFFGSTGVGKSQLAAEVLARAYEKHHCRGQWWSVADIKARLLATYDRDHRTETTEAAMAELCRWPLLVLDDLGAEVQTPDAEEKIWMIINSRHEQMLPTIFTANTDSRGWDALHQRVKSRVMQNAAPFMGGDRRGSRFAA